MRRIETTAGNNDHQGHKDEITSRIADRQDVTSDDSELARAYVAWVAAQPAKHRAEQLRKLIKGWQARLGG